MITAGKAAIGGGIALVAFLVTYGIASASEKPKSATPAKDVPKAGETIDISTVKGVQKGVIALGFSVGSTGADDKYGPNTAAGVAKASVSLGGANSGIINNAFRALLAKALRAKGYTVIGETGPTFETTATYSSGPTSSVMTKEDAIKIACNRGTSDGKSEAEDKEPINSKWEVDEEDKSAFKAYTQFKSDFEISYKNCYLAAYNKAKPWYEEGLTVTETGKLSPKKLKGEWGTRNLTLALANPGVAGRKFGLV